MLLHTVLFWLKKELTERDFALFEQKVLEFKKISPVKQLFLGRPASTPKRPVIDDSYHYCLTVVLEDITAHNAYQEDPIHLEFIKECSHMWEKVKIYDSEWDCSSKLLQEY